MQTKTVERNTGGGFMPVEELEEDGETQRPFDEAAPQEHDVSCTLHGLLAVHETSVSKFPQGASPS